MKRNIFKLFLNKFLAYPLWIKQVIYYRLWQNMKENNCENLVMNLENNLMAMHIPTLTFQGKQELLDKKLGLDSNIYNFLKYSHNDYSIMETALNMFMSVEEIAKIYIFCLEQNYIVAPQNDEIYVMAGFISGKFPIGDYLLRKKIISREQLDYALKEQILQDERGPHKLLGEILISSGSVREQDIKLLFKLKSDSKKRFVLNPEFLPENKNEEKLINKMEREIKALKAENKALKSVMTKIVNTVKNYDI